MKKIQLIIDKEAVQRYEEHYFSIHTKAHKKPIAHPYQESINAWMIMKRPMMNALKQKWKDFICYFVEEQGYANLGITKCKICQTVYYPNNRRHDTDNSVPKFILDGLVQGGMVVDDDSNHITELTLRCRTDTSNPRTELLITILPDETTDK